jgi:hypothetical protein
MTDLIRAANPVARSFKVLLILVVCSVMNEKCTKSTGAQKKHYIVRIPPVNGAQVQVSLDGRTTMNTSAESTKRGTTRVTTP